MWKDGKRWVYSVTYDEGCQALLEHALAVHRRYGVPGHVCLVASQVGVPRNVPGSSYDGMMILSAEEIAMLRGEGWGASCHGMTHQLITEQNWRNELLESRELLEATLGTPISIFCLPGSNQHFPVVREHAAEAGYQGVLTIYDDINRLPLEAMRLCRVPLHTEYPPPFYSAFDRFKRLHQAQEEGGWVIDYCHCPMPGAPIHPWKDCTLEQLEERFATVLEVGGEDVWLAEPNEVLRWALSASEVRT
ncbi:MAG: polysaccharide deacetylase family protein [Armatimonadota bacterium]